MITDKISLKQFLEDNELYSLNQIQQLKKVKENFLKLKRQLIEIEEAMKKQFKISMNCVKKVEVKPVQYVRRLIKVGNSILEDLQSQNNFSKKQVDQIMIEKQQQCLMNQTVVEIQKIPERPQALEKREKVKKQNKNTFHNSKTSIKYQCGCSSFSTQEVKEFNSHHQMYHKNQLFIKGSSHFQTIFGNPIKIPSCILNLIKKEGDMRKEIQKDNQILMKKEQQKRKQSEKIEEKSTQKMKKISKKVMTNQIYEFKTPEKPTQARNIFEPKISKPSKLMYSHNPEKDGTFYCGNCLITFSDLNHYIKHFKIHSYMIDRSCSHVLQRQRKKQDIIPIRIEPKNDESRYKRYYCPCTCQKQQHLFNHRNFIEHVLKWHKGITPYKT